MIVGISGRKNSGKSYTASIIARSLGRCVILGFADPIRSFIADLAGLTLAELDDLKNKPTANYRTAMQSLGTWGRTVNPDMWIDHWERRADNVLTRVLTEPVAFGSHTGGYRLDKADHVIVPDLRFVNEAVRIKEKGGVILFKEGGVEGDVHESETEMMSDAFQALVDCRIPHYDFSVTSGSLRMQSDVMDVIDEYLWVPVMR